MDFFINPSGCRNDTIEKKKKRMNRQAFQFLVTFVTSLLIILGISFFFLFRHLPQSVSSSVAILQTLALACTLSPFALLIASAYAFVGSNEVDSNHFFSASRSLLVLLLLCLIFSTLLSWFGGDFFEHRRLQSQIQESKVSFEKALAQAKDLDSIKASYLADRSSASATLETLKNLEAEFPYDLEISKMIDFVIKDSVDKSNLSTDSPKNISPLALESKAVECLNLKDYLGAVHVYDKILKQINTDRAYASEKRRIEIARETAHSNDLNRMSRLSVEETEKIRLRRELKTIDLELDDAHYYDVFPTVKNLAVIDSKNPEIRERWARLEKAVRVEEFSILDFMDIKKYWKEPLQLVNVNFSFGETQFHCDSLWMTPHYLYAEKPRVKIEGHLVEGAFGRIKDNQLQIKDVEKEKSFITTIPDLERTSRFLAFQVEEYRHALYYLGPLELIRYRHFAQDNLKQDTFYYRLLENIKWNLPLFLLSFGLLWIAHSFEHRHHSKGLTYFLFLIIASVFSLFSFAFIIYFLTSLGMAKHQEDLYRLLSLIFNGLVLTGCVYRFSRTH
jgi:hypothetical protein